MGNLLCGYYVAEPNQYIVKTGINIDNMQIIKSGMKYPFQKIRILNLDPHNYTFTLEAMTSEKLEFLIPCVFTIGPLDFPKELEKYSKLLNEKSYDDIQNIIKGVIEGECRGIAANMSIEDIFSDRNAFKLNIINEVQKELNYFGLFIYNANIKELEDFPGSKYFVYIKQKAVAEAKNNALINVANADFNGDVYIKERERDLRIKKAELEYSAIEYENNKQAEIAKSKADLTIKQAEYNKLSNIANIESEKASQIKEIQLQKKLESENILKQTELLRATVLTRTNVESESIERSADAESYRKKCIADADKYSKNAITDSNQYQIIQESKADLIKQKNIAEATQVLLNSQAEGLTNLLLVNDNTEFILKYLMIEGGVLERLSKTNADAIQGLNPKITHWTTSNTNSNPINDIMKSLPPLVETIYDQTGIKPPQWIASDINN